METVVSGSYVQNVVIPFVTGSLLGLATTNSVGLLLNSGGLSITVQLITTVVPLFFWFVAMSLSHPWTSKMTARFRAAVHSMIATFIVLIWLTFISLMFIVSSPSSAGVPMASIIMASLLELFLLLSMIVASFVNAFISSRGVPSEKEAGFKDIRQDLNEALTLADETKNNEKLVKKPSASNSKPKTSSKTATKKTTNVGTKTSNSKTGTKNASTDKKPVAKKPATKTSSKTTKK